MLQIRNLVYSIGERKLINGASCVINPAKRAALIGPNGTGKTTLLRILNGEIRPEAGDIIKPKDYIIGYLPQEEIAVGRGSILEIALQGKNEVIDLETRIHELRQRLSNNEGDHDELLKQLGNYEHRYEALDGYRLESSVKAILSGLGFSETDFHRPLSDFSGGWRMRVYLTRLLIQKPDLLLLDEPTNHLDLPSLEWLEQYLVSFPGSIIIVSHDRYFIDRLAQEIFELEWGRLVHYPGNYHFYEKRKEENLELLLKKQEQIRDERERQEKFINRFRYKATKATQVQSRIKQLEKLEEIELPPPPKQISFNIYVEQTSYKDVLEIRNMSFRYTDNWVLQHINLNLYRGEKIALVGVNGAGKTTLTRLIVGQLSPQEGIVQVGQRSVIGYYAQHQVDTLNLDSTVYDEVSSTVAPGLIPRVRDILGIFQFSGDDVFKRIRVLSGGEKARVSLAKILLSPVNFLIMDEPTNHLDISSKEALEKALQSYNGTLILISHDRYFLDKLVSRVVEIKDKQFFEYAGNYTHYLERRDQQQLAIKKTDIPTLTGKKSKEEKRLQAEARQAISKQRNQMEKEIGALESRIGQLENRIAEIETLMADPELYKNEEKAVAIPKEYAAAKKQLEADLQSWEAIHLQLDQLLSSLESSS
ncbi:MAG TPA: ATP-binding cassette domain-containing protein [bacterium]|nr:ATP-binding cassette domain-containing protein [bacterium]HPN43392.1 ATP-binding cassette domain-containing protein [bacterium]